MFSWYIPLTSIFRNVLPSHLFAVTSSSVILEKNSHAKSRKDPPDPVHGKIDFYQNYLDKLITEFFYSVNSQ